MEITVSEAQGRVPVTIFHLVGDLDVQTHGQLEAKVQECLQTGTQYVLLDLSQVPYVSSYGIRAISQVFSWLKALPGEEETVRAGVYKSHNLKLLNPTPTVMNVLTTTGLDMYLEVYNDQQKAVASF